MKKKGLTLIELVVVVALVVILSFITFIKLKNQIAKAKDVKVVSILGTLRLGSELSYVSEEKATLNGRTEVEALNEIISKTDDNIKRMFDEGPFGNENNVWEEGEISLEVGGHRINSDSLVMFGGGIDYTFIDPKTSTTGDGIDIWLKPQTGIGEYDTVKNRWDTY